MPTLDRTATCRAPAAEVWKLLHDPTRFPEWWAGLDRVQRTGEGVTRYLEAWPDFPYPTRVHAREASGQVTVSCLLSDIRHDWTLSPAPDGCRIHVHVELPESEAQRLEAAREEIEASLPRLVAAAESVSATERRRRRAG